MHCLLNKDATLILDAGEIYILCDIREYTVVIGIKSCLIKVPKLKR